MPGVLLVDHDDSGSGQVVSALALSMGGREGGSGAPLEPV